MHVVRICGLLGVYLQQRRRQPKCHQADAKERCRLTHLEYTTKRLHAAGFRHPLWCCVHSTPATLASVHQHGLHCIVWCQLLRYAATSTRIFLHCVLQGALWSPSKRALPPTPEGIVRARTKEFEARGQVRFFQDFRSLGLARQECVDLVPTSAYQASGHLICHPCRCCLRIRICMSEKQLANPACR